MFSPAFWWTIVGVVLMICEFVVPGLILFFFGIGALATALATLFVPLSLTGQLIVFVIASLVSLFGLRRYLKRIFTGRIAARSGGEGVAEGMVGESGEVSEAISPEKTGKIVLNGVAWKAESDQVLEVGDRVVVAEQKSLLLKVERK